jgi:hypothetical protein
MHRFAAQPGIRLLPEGTWALLMAAVRVAFLLLLLLSAWPPANAAAGPLPAPPPGAFPP